MSKRSRGAAMLLAAGGSLPDPPPASSPKPCLASGSPSTSPASKRHAADKQTGTTTPHGIPETQPTPKGLPEHLKRLQAVFELMLSGRGLLKRRAEKITATTLAPIVESVTKRNFKVEYVQQIKFLYPEAFDWQYVRVPSEHDKNRLDFQLLLQFERCTAPGGASCPSDISNSMGNCSNSVARINEAAERAALLARATAWFEAQQAQGAPADTPVPCAPLPPKDPTSMIIGGSPMHAHRRMSSSPAHLRNSLQAIHHATRQQQQQQQQQSLQAAGSSPTLHRGTGGSGPSLQQQHQQRQQAEGSSPTTHRATVGAGPSLQQQQQRQQAAGSSPTMHRATVSDGASWMRAGGPSPPPSRHRGDASDAREGSPTLHRGTVGSGSSWMRAGGLSPPQPRQRDKAGGTYEGREAITAGLASPDADIGAPSPRQQDSGGVGPNSPTAAAALEGGLGTPPNHLPYHERRSGRPGGTIPLPTTPTSSRAKQRMHGDCFPVNSGAAWRGTITESSRGALAGAGGLGTPGAEDTATPRMARRRLQLGADLFGRAAGDGSGVDQQLQQQQQQQQQQSQSQQQQPQAQQQQPWLQQQQQQEGPASLGARGSVSCGGTKGASQDIGQDAKAQMDDGAASDLLVLDEHAEDMSAFDEEPMTVQVPMQSISASPATPASSQHHTRPQGGTPASGGSRRQSLLSRFMSPQSLEALQRNAQKAQQSPALKAKADLLQSQRMLPQAMDLVRAVFGLKGPVVKQREELVELMRQKSSLSIALSSSEAARALQQLLQHAPEMISQEQQGGVWVIRLRRTADVNAVRTRLCSIACQAARSSTASSPTK